MINVKKIKFYSGSKLNEKPEIIFTDRGIIRVNNLIELRLEEDSEEHKRSYIFIFESLEGDKYKLKVSGSEYNLTEL